MPSLLFMDHFFPSENEEILQEEEKTEGKSSEVMESLRESLIVMAEQQASVQHLLGLFS